MKHLFIINPISFPLAGRLDRFCSEVEECFSGDNVAEYKIHVSRYPRDAIATIYRYFTANSSDEQIRVYAVGGDGILFDCLNGVVYFKNAELASIPYGKANDFVRGFGENKNELFRNLKIMSTAPTIPTDIIKCGTSFSLTGCAIGVEAAAVANVEKAARVLKKHPRVAELLPTLYNLGGALYVMRSGRTPHHYSMNFDGKDYSGKYLNINLSNIGVNGGTNTVNPYANPVDGVLNGVLAGTAHPLIVLMRIVSYVNGKFVDYPSFFSHVRFSKMSAVSKETMAVILDGETYFSKKVELEIIPKAINAVAPMGESYIGGERLHGKT